MALKNTTDANTTLTILNAFDLSLIRELEENDGVDIEKLLLVAEGLFRDKKTWLPEAKRIDVLEKTIQLMQQRSQNLAKTIARESGKPLSSSLEEVSNAINTVRIALGVLYTQQSTNFLSEGSLPIASRPTACRTEPIGTVVTIITCADPLYPAVFQIIAAIATGCPIILRPSPQVPLSCLDFISILHKAGLPSGWVQHVLTTNIQLLEMLASDERVSLLSYLGLAEGAWKLRAKLPPKTTFILHEISTSPVIVMDDCDVYEVREALLKSCFFRTRQSNGSVQLIFAHTSIATNLSTQLAMKAAGLRVGNPLSENTQIGPLINTADTNRIHEYVLEAIQEGGQLLTGGERLAETIYAPTVIFNPPKTCKLMQENAFGPVALIIPWFKMEDIIEQTNLLAKAYRVSLFTRNIEKAFSVSQNVQAPILIINDVSFSSNSSRPLHKKYHSEFEGIEVRQQMEKLTVKKYTYFKNNY